MKDVVPNKTLMKDGLSQKGRVFPALDTQYFKPDERGVSEWLDFVRNLSALIPYHTENLITLTWKDFANWEAVGLTKQEILEYLRDPTTLAHDQQKTEWLARPHFVLLLSFLKLLAHPQNKINEFTKRHLDFYYRDFLQFKNRAFSPDLVHLVTQLEDNQNFVVKKGTLLNAGKGPDGEDILFGVTRDFFLNNARISEVKSIFLDQQELDMAKIRVKYFDTVDEEYGFWPVLRLAYGYPNPGDNLPLFKDKHTVDEEFFDSLKGLDNILKSTTALIGLSVSDFKTLFQTKNTAGKDDVAAWNVVNYLLSKAGQEKRGDNTFSIEGVNSSNFNTKLFTAIGEIQLPLGFKTLDEYYQWMIDLEKYFFLSMEDLGFVVSLRDELLRIKEVDAGAWKKLFELLEVAYEKKEISERKSALRSVRLSSGFNAMMEFALGDPQQENALPAYSHSLTEIYADLGNTRHISYLRDELFLSVKDFSGVMQLNATQATDEKWSSGYDILERAMRQKRGLATEKPSVKEWYNLYKGEDATKIKSRGTSGWLPFGNAQMPQAEIGLMLSSPLLEMKKGDRQIEVTLIFAQDNFDEEKIATRLADKNFPPFGIKLSTKTGFFAVPHSNAVFTLAASGELEKQHRGIRIAIALAKGDPAVEACDEGVEKEVNPSLKLLLLSEKDGQKTKIPYDLFKDLQLIKAHVLVSAKNVDGLVVENDNGQVNTKKPFEPFGKNPLVGSRFYFMNDEITRKRIDTLTLNLDWMGLPKDMANYYKDYTELTGQDFTATLRLRNNNVDYTLHESFKLFSEKQSLDVAERIKSKGYPSIAFASNTEQWDGDEIANAYRFFCLDLNTPDFQHTNYPALAALKAMEYAGKLREDPKTNPSLYQVNPPYTPLLKSFTIDYTSSATITLSNSEAGKMFCIHPFGLEQITSAVSHFLPSYEDEGTLLIGFENLKVPDTISIFFKVLEGSAHPEMRKPDVQFSYLTKRGWTTLTGANIIYDSTRGLSSSGIIQFAMPADAVDDSTVMPAGKHWVRISVASGTAGIDSFLNIYAQGLEASMVSSANYVTLAAESITSTREEIPAIKSIFQPYPSFGGRTAEDDTFFYTRISERLRHKNRSVSSWDYERMILQEFPEVYKTKVLPVNPESKEVTVIAIPDLKVKAGMNPYEPRLRQKDLEQIEKYLTLHASAFARIRVINPEYLKVKIRVSVRLKEGYNSLHSQQVINEALKHYLSPWAFEGGDIIFGERIHANTIVNFLENQQCVAYVVGLKFFTSGDGMQYEFVAPTDHNINHVTSPDPKTILVSAEQHDIDIIENDRIDYDDLSGIGYMKVQLDFKID